MAYNAASVSDSVIAFRKPITLQQGRALRDNPIAMVQGLEDAPVNEYAWHPYDMVLVGDGNDGAFYSGSAVSTIDTPAFEDGYEYQIIIQDLLTNTGAVSLRANVYRETAGTLAAARDISDANLSTGNKTGGIIEVPRARVVEPLQMLIASIATLDGTTDPSTTKAVGFDMGSSGDAVQYVRFSLSSGAFASGVMYLYRRRCL